MPNVTYTQVYVCLQPNSVNPALCDAWQATNSGDYITPEISGIIIMFAFTINLVVAGFKSMRRVM